MKPKVIVFDLWNTLVYDPSKESHEEIANILSFKNRQEFWDYCDVHFFHRKITFYDFIKELIQQRNLPEKTFDVIQELWEESRKHVKLYTDTIETLKRLKKKYSLALLSNSAEREALEVIDRFDLKKYFEKIFISSQLGVSKPNPKAFQLVLDHFQIKPEQTIFVGDDVEMDIIPAMMLGLKGILVDTRKKYPEYEDEDWYISSLNQLKL